MSATPTPNAPDTRPSAAPFIAGLTLIAAFFALRASTNGMFIALKNQWDFISGGEGQFWAGAFAFLLPGASLVGASLAPRVAALSARGERASGSLEAWPLWGALFAVAAAFAAAGHAAVLNSMPITDDESAARFGGLLLAQGRALTPLPPLWEAFPDLFLFRHAGRWGSVEFPGGIAAWALAEVTHTGPLVFHLLAACAPLGVALAVRRAQGAAWGLVAGALVLASPAGALLSFTTHTHVVSRGLLALAFAVMLFVPRLSVTRAFAAGALLGAAFTARPAESFALAAPLVVWHLARAFRDRALRLPAGALLAGLGLMYALFQLYNRAVTGEFTMARNMPNEVFFHFNTHARPMWEPSAIAHRFGSNVAYNALMLWVFWLGPAGALLAVLGARRSPEHTALALGVALDLGVALLHDDRGLHIVGPIHYAEAVVPLTVLAAAALPRVEAACVRAGAATATVRGAVLGYAGIGLTLFTAWQSLALHESCVNYTNMLEALTDTPRRPAVVLAPTVSAFRATLRSYERRGGYVGAWPRARPDLREDVLVLLDSPQARARVRRAFPDRTPYVFKLPPGRWGLQPLPEAPAGSPREE